MGRQLEQCRLVHQCLDETGQVCGAKRLNKLRKRYPLERVLVVDDSPEKHLKNFGNLVRVAPFEGDPNDRELDALSVYLTSLATCTNLRAVEKRGWRSQIKRNSSDEIS